MSAEEFAVTLDWVESGTLMNWMWDRTGQCIILIKENMVTDDHTL